MSTINLHLGDCRTVLQSMTDNSVDSVVVDPPYGLSKEPDMLEVLRHWLNGDDYSHTGKGFMGKSWDSFVPGPSVWKECFRVLKPGGHLVSFFGSRTYDMGTLAIRLAGFEIRDQLMWLHGSGFPKSLDVSKAIDKAAGVKRQVIGQRDTRSAYDNHNRAEFNRKDRDVAFDVTSGCSSNTVNITTPATDEAQTWQGWGSALKPAHEPIALARKPLAGTIAQNVLTHGTGGLNIDGCRIAFAGLDDQQGATWGRGTDIIGGNYVGATHSSGKTNIEANPQGRFPANVAHDGSDEVLKAFAQFGDSNSRRIESPSQCNTEGVTSFDAMRGNRPARGYTDSGSPARFFYCAKADREDRDEGCRLLNSRPGGMVSNTSGQHMTRRDEGYAPSKVKNHHPTVKPVALMQWLCRLVTPPGGIVLDPYMGSGSTGKAAVKEGFGFVGIELDPEYYAIAEARITHAARKYNRQTTLFHP